MVERMIQDFAVAHRLKFAMLRYFNASGADPDNQIGEDHNPETHLIPLVLDVALGAAKSTVFGTTTPRPTAPASATTSTSPIWPPPTSARSRR